MFPRTQALEARPDDRDPTVSRLVGADVTWAYCRFPRRVQSEEQVYKRHRRLLSELLALNEDARGYPSAWIRHEPELPDAEQAAEWLESKDPILAPYRWFDHQERGAPRWRRGAGAQRVVGLIASGLEQCGKVATRAWMQGQEQLLAAQMNLFACRIYLDPQHAARLAGQADPSAPEVHACIDFRFKEHSGECVCRYWLYATLSVWTYKPLSPNHAPALPTPITGKDPLKATAPHDWYAKVRAGLKRRVSDYFPLAEMEILGHEYRPPQFWFAPTIPNVAEDLDNERLKELVGVLLRAPDVRSTGMAAGVIDDRMLVLRRFVPDAGGDLPCYLAIPIRGTAVEQENDARKLMGRLTDLEAAAAAQLFEVVTNLDLHAGHLRAYEAVAHQAEELWDQLALYLPVARWRLSRVHKLIELVHQTLLQGIADLDQVAIQASEAARKVERAASDLKDEFDRTLTERSLPDERSIRYRQSIRSSLTETGYFDKAARQAERVRKDAEQVQRSYDTLLEGITRAFDERRVRGTDVLQRVGLWLAILAGVFAFLPEAINAMFTNWDKMFPHLAHRPVVLILVIAGMVLSVPAVLWVLLRKRWLSRLGSRRFRRRHRRLREFLARCATDRLIRLRDDGWKRVRAMLDDSAETREWTDIFTAWDDLDRALARRCAKLLDKLARDQSAQPIRTDKPPRFKHLARRVERWALKALLVSERPRQFWQFPLLRLTFLYRFYPMMRGELQSSSIPAANEGVASDVDFTLAFWTQCRAGHEQIDQINAWAKRQLEQPRSAADFVKALDKVGLKAGMTRKDFEATLERMRA